MAVHRLTPGQGLYVPAGVMHAYLSGTILEIMATSDNVIRGGLTHKYIDIEDLLRTLRFDASPLRVDPEPDTEEPCALHWRTPAREFSLSKYVLQTQASVGFTVSGPEILLCTEGTCVVRPSAADLPVTLGKGTSVFISPASKNCTLRGEAVVYRARTAAAEHRLS